MFNKTYFTTIILYLQFIFNNKYFYRYLMSLQYFKHEQINLLLKIGKNINISQN